MLLLHELHLWLVLRDKCLPAIGFIDEDDNITEHLYIADGIPSIEKIMTHANRFLQQHATPNSMLKDDL